MDMDMNAGVEVSYCHFLWDHPWPTLFQVFRDSKTHLYRIEVNGSLIIPFIRYINTFFARARAREEFSGLGVTFALGV